MPNTVTSSSNTSILPLLHQQPFLRHRQFRAIINSTPSNIISLPATRQPSLQHQQPSLHREHTSREHSHDTVNLCNTYSALLYLQLELSPIYTNNLSFLNIRYCQADTTICIVQRLIWIITSAENVWNFEVLILSLPQKHNSNLNELVLSSPQPCTWIRCTSDIS